MLSPSVVSDRLHKDRGLTTRTLKKLMTKDWVGRIGEGNRAYYFITAKGEAANRRIKDS
jgi:DNA-binding PadR family transcriptional regulator